jgi:DNA polymerase I
MNILLLDANNLINRAFYAIPLMFNKNGIPNNALRGFSNTILNLKEEHKIDKVIAAFDKGIPEWRMKAVPCYKANRGEKPKELKEQLKIAEEVLCQALGINIIKREKTEADDILYTLTLRCEEENHASFIASGDKDIAQCLKLKNSTLLRPPKKSTDPWEKIDKEKSKEILGVNPEKIAEFLAIVGDKVDNMPGVEGVGPKTAIRWIEEFGGLEEIIKNKNLLKPERLSKNISEEQLRKNLLITESYDTKDQIPEFEPTPNTETLRELGIYKVAMRMEKNTER